MDPDDSNRRGGIDLDQAVSDNFDGWYGHDDNTDVLNSFVIDINEGLSGNYLHLYMALGEQSTNFFFDLVEVMAFEASRIKTKPNITNEEGEDITDQFEWVGELS